MASTHGATFGGINLLSSSPVQWKLMEGVRPSVGFVEIEPKFYDTMINLAGQPRDLLINGSDGSTVKAVGLFIQHSIPANNPHIKRLQLADRRWTWHYGHYLRRFNIRRKVGYHRLKNPNLLVLQDVVPEVWYAAFSTKDEDGKTPWTGLDILYDILNAILDHEEESGIKSLPGWLVDEDIQKNLRDLPIEDLTIDDPLDQALDRILAYLPSAGVTISLNGEIRIFSKATAADETAIAALGPEIVGGGHIEAVDNAALRPTYIDVLFTREIETRFDFIERASYKSTVVQKNDERFMENVLPCPDYDLNVIGKKGKTCQGTWLTFPEALGAWADTSNGPLSGLGRALDFSDIQKAMVPFMDLWGAVRLIGLHTPDVNWNARIAAIQAHYRRTFRINRRWMDRILNLHNYRVAIVDPVTGTRAPSAVYANYSYLPSQRSMIKEAQSGYDMTYASNQDGYPAGGVIGPTTPLMCAATVSIVDHDQGIIQLDFKLDPTRMFEQVMPSWITVAGQDIGGAGLRPSIAGPMANIRRWREFPLTFDSVFSSGRMKVPSLTSDHKVAIIITATPGSPNTDNQLHRVRVYPADIESVLPVALRKHVRTANGPPLEIRVGGGIETARVAWMDARKHDIEAVFGVGKKMNDKRSSEDMLAGLVINDKPQALIGDRGASLQSIAHAMAAREYSALANKTQGSATGKYNANIEVAGWISEVTHGIDASHRIVTHMALAEQLPKMSMWSMMDGQTRAIVMKLAQPGK